MIPTPLIEELYHHLIRFGIDLKQVSFDSLYPKEDNLFIKQAKLLSELLNDSNYNILHSLVLNLYIKGILFDYILFYLERIENERLNVPISLKRYQEVNETLSTLLKQIQLFSSQFTPEEYSIYIEPRLNNTNERI